MQCSDVIEFATCASVLKHSIIGEINMVDENKGVKDEQRIKKFKYRVFK